MAQAVDPFQVERVSEGEVRAVVNLSGTRKTLTLEQEREARELAQSSLEKGGSRVPFFNRDPLVVQRGNFIVTEVQRQQAVFGVPKDIIFLKTAEKQQLEAFEGGRRAETLTSQEIKAIKREAPNQPARSEDLVGLSVSSNLSQESKQIDKGTMRLTEQEKEFLNRPLDVQAVEKPSGLLEGFIFDVKTKQQQTKTQQLREGDSGSSFFKSVGLGFSGSALSTAFFGKSLVTDTKETLGAVGTGITSTTKKLFTPNGFSDIGTNLKQDTGSVAGSLLFEAITLKGTGKILKVVEKGTDIASVKFSPKEKAIVNIEGKDVINLNKDNFKNIPLIRESVTDISIPLKEQAKLIGKTDVQAVSGARSFFKPLIDKVVINKPLPKPTSPKLEKSFFLDPFGRLRLSRTLVSQKEAGLSDILSGNFSFKREKPQAIVVKADVKNLPLDITKSLKEGKTLSLSQQKRLEKIQLTPSGKFNPIGFLSKEPEFTISPKETLKKKAKLGVTLINGQKVDIFEGEIVKTPKEILKITSKGKVSPKDLIKLDDIIKKDLGFSSILIPPPPRVRGLSSFGFSLGRRLSSKDISLSKKLSAKSSLSKSSKGSGRSTLPSLLKLSRSGRGGRSPRSFFRGSPSISRGSPSPSLTGSSPRGRGGRGIDTPKTFDTKGKAGKRGKGSLSVQIRRRGKFFTIGAGLNLKEALSLGKGRVQDTLGATFKISGDVAKGIRTPEGFRRKETKSGTLFIERRKFRLSTKGEKKEIKRAKRRKKK